MPTINPYSMAYRMIHEMEMEKHKKAEKYGLLQKEVKIWLEVIKTIMVL